MSNGNSATNRSIARVLTCGSVDNGKSTLIGRILFDSGNIPDDQLATLKVDSRKYGTSSGDYDFALLLDGLEAEREQGITIDVSYRYFSTPKRRFIVADCPGHEQYTRNMATGASNSGIAIILIDALKGISEQTWRHTSICSLMGIRHAIFVVNKIDLVQYSQQRFDDIGKELEQRLGSFDFKTRYVIPVCATTGDNIVTRSEQLNWLSGPPLLEYLEDLDTQELTREANAPLRLPVQFVSRPNAEFRGYSGTLCGGRVEVGQDVCVTFSKSVTRVKEIFKGSAPVQSADDGDAVTICIEDDLDISRGAVLASIDQMPQESDHLAADIVWFNDNALLANRSYIVLSGCQRARAWITTIKYRLDVKTQDHLAARELKKNEIGRCHISLSHPIAFDEFERNATMGSFILIDQVSSETVGCGLIRFSLRRAVNVERQELRVSHKDHSAIKGHSACCIWLTGLSGAGKTTIGNLLELQLNASGVHTALLDGDNLRLGLNRDLGFVDADRAENVRRVAHVAKLMVDAGLIVIVAAISPFTADREMARALFSDGQFVEVFVDTPIDECERRDPKGLYRKAHLGLIPNFTGVSAPYETPESPEVVLNSVADQPEVSAGKIRAYLASKSVFE